MSREMKKGLVDMVVLSVIARGAVSGVDLVVELEELFPTGTIYPALSRLERNGWVNGINRLATTGRNRKEHDLSPSGREELAVLTAEWDSLWRSVEHIKGRVTHDANS
jgi:PadR family transcriptional regulator, regulatory protein PadR